MTKNDQSEIIGIVGGVGPYAGVDLKKKIFDNTKAFSDQEHLEIYLLSSSNRITDRTAFLNDPSNLENPAIAIFNVIKKLYKIGADVIGIPCNTSHSPLIFDKIKFLIDNEDINVELLNMIEETNLYIKNELKDVKKAGLLATLGTYGSMVYQETFKSSNIEILIPDENDKERVHKAIYDKSYGVKAFSNPVAKKAKEEFKNVITALKTKGAQAIILGCTEIPLALNNEDSDIPLIDPTTVLARALISRVDKNKLKN